MDWITIAIIFIVLLTLYTKFTEGVCRSYHSMEGKTVIVTGANAGIGLETARELAKRHARVILACRNLEKGLKALEDIRYTTGNNNLCLMHLDLSSLKSVRKFADEIKTSETKLDVLIQNAGLVPEHKKKLTEDNIEICFATNHFGPFLLTYLLLDLLKASPSGRIIVVSAFGHWFGHLDFKNINNEKHHKHPAFIYFDTKLANILFTRELAKRLRGTNVTVNSLHPGVVKTHIGDKLGWHVEFLYKTFFLFKTPLGGAQTSVYLAVAKKVEGVSGKYFSDCRESSPSLCARNDKVAAKLWDMSEKLTEITFS